MTFFNFNSGSPDPSVPRIVGSHIRIPRILPVLREDKSLQLLLPAEYTDIGQVPVPTDARVVIRSLPERTVAVEAFHGTSTRQQYVRRVRLLQDKLEDQGLLGAGDYVPPVVPLTLKEPATSEAKHGEVISTPAAGVNVSSAARDASTSAGVDDMNKWTVAQYHSHSTLFFLRRNEVWIQLESANPQVVKLQAKIKK